MGGNVFEDTQPIPSEWADELFMQMYNRLDPYRMIALGSFSRGGKDSYGDLDIAIEITPEVFQALFDKFSIDYQCKRITAYTFSVRYVFGSKAYQVDFIMSDNLDETYDRFYNSPDSAYKGVYRNMMIEASIKVQTVKVIGNGIRVRQHLDLYDGLVYLVQSDAGANGNTTKRYRTLDRVRLNCRYSDMLQKFFGTRSIKSFEDALDVIVKHEWFPAKDKRLAILEEAAEMMTSHNLTVPHELREEMERLQRK